MIWHCLYYGPTYWIVIQNMIEIDYEAQKYHQGVALYAIIMYFGVNFILSNQLFKEPAFIQKLTIKTIKDVGYILI